VTFVLASDARVFLHQLDDESVDLFVLDPPYLAVRDLWDHEWKTAEEYSAWLVGLCLLARRKVKPKGSLIMFNGIGRHGEHPLFDVIKGLERGGWFFRNWITWKRPRAFGKSENYLFGRRDRLVLGELEARRGHVQHAAPRHEAQEAGQDRVPEGDQRVGRHSARLSSDANLPTSASLDRSPCSDAQQPWRPRGRLLRWVREHWDCQSQPWAKVSRLRADRRGRRSRQPASFRSNSHELGARDDQVGVQRTCTRDATAKLRRDRMDPLNE